MNTQLFRSIRVRDQGRDLGLLSMSGHSIKEYLAAGFKLLLVAGALVLSR